MWLNFYDTITFSESVDETYVNIGNTFERNITQEFSIEDYSIYEALVRLRSPLQNLNIDVYFDRLALVSSKILQRIEFNILTDRSFLGERKMTDEVTIFDSTGRIVANIRGLSQLISISDSVDRFFEGIRTPLQNINIEDYQRRIIDVTIDLSENININVYVIRVKYYLASVSDIINFVISASGDYTGIYTPPVTSCGSLTTTVIEKDLSESPYVKLCYTITFKKLGVVL